MTARTLRLAALLLALLGAATLAAAPVAALSLDEAKAKGLLGEQADGYVGVVGSGSGEARALAERVNAERRERYAEIARKNGAPVKDVAALAGKKLVERTPAGGYVRGRDGGWVRK